jgi:hypothetical protein
MMIRCVWARDLRFAGFAMGILLSACGDEARLQTDAALPDAAKPDAAIDAPPAIIPPLQIKSLSNRADLISGGDALIEIVIPAGAPADPLHVQVGDRDVTSAFARRKNSRTIGLVTDLRVGQSTITANLGGHLGAQLVITNHPIGGPVFSGPQVQPWVCATPVATPGDADHAFTSGSGLSTNATDDQCNIATETKLYYRTTLSADPLAPKCSLVIPDPATPPNPPVTLPRCFQPFDPAGPVPADMAMTTTDAGVTVPYIVRLERGTLNRGIYDLAVLYDPTKTGWDPAEPQVTWNGKVLYLFGASTGQPRRQQRSAQQWSSQDDALKRGFLVAMANMTDSALNSNRTSMTETLMMLKEHIADTYGEIRFTMGAGCSGGSINQLTATSIFPGLLDGIQPSCTYPDSETTGVEVADCELLVRFYASADWRNLLTTEGKTLADNLAKQKAINGHLDHRGCRSWFNAFIGVARPGLYFRESVDLNNEGTITQGTTPINNCTLPNNQVYAPDADHVNLPRCTGQDHAASIWGLVPGTTHAPSTRDNVGVVYGLKALASGAINQDEFVLLNQKIGGADFDINRTDARSSADLDALPIAYRAGIVMDARHFSKIPIIDLRGFDEFGIHYIWRSFSLRARLDAAGGHGNHVLWRFPVTLTPPPQSKLLLESFNAMDKWLTALHTDTSDKPFAQRVLDDKPQEAFDFCYLSIDTGFQFKMSNTALCDLDPGLATHSSPRQVAGGPVTEDILKCQLKPIDHADFPGLDDAHFQSLSAVFPDGVCDWSKPGVGQQPAASPLDFSGGPGGVPLPAAPSSQPL